MSKNLLILNIKTQRLSMKMKNA